MAVSVNHKISRTISLVLIAVSTALLIKDADAAHVRQRQSLDTADRIHSQHRVRQPCAGSRTAEQVFETEQTDDVEDNEIGRANDDVRRRISAVGDKLQALYGLVSDFMTLYVSNFYMNVFVLDRVRC
jgi:hypothetical protein